MTIEQKPEVLSFCGNINDFVISGSSRVNFVLSLSGIDIINEEYESDTSGIIRIRINDVVKDFLSVHIPAYNTDLFVQADACKNFRATINDQTVGFTVLSGGIEFLTETIAEFLQRNFLSWQPQEKRIIARQPEWLSYYATVDSVLKIQAYFSDNTTGLKTFSLVAGNLYTANLNYDKINSYFNQEIGYYDAWVEAGGQRVSYIQRYILIPEPDPVQLYVFENSLGGIDSFICTGLFSVKSRTEATTGTVLNVTSEANNEFAVIYTQNTGYLHSQESAKWLHDFFVSRQRYHVTENLLRKIFIEDSENEFKVGEINAFSFEFRYTDQTEFNRVIRNRNNLSELLEFPLADKLFFLTPRLSEYPVAPYSDDLIFPVQHPYTGKWCHLPASFFKPGTGSGWDLIDNLTSTRADAGLTANMGRYLKSLIDGKASSWDTISGKPDLFPPAAHHHLISDVTGLQESLSAKLDQAVWNSYFYTKDGQLYCKTDLIGEKSISAYGLGPDGSSGGGWDLIDELTSTRADAGLTANMGRYLKSLIDGKASSWDTITGKPDFFPPARHTHSVSSIIDLDTVLITKLEQAVWDSYFYTKNGQLYCKTDLIGEKSISAYGLGPDGSSGGGWDLIDELTSTRTDAGLTANMGRYLKSLIDGKASSWDTISGKPDLFPTSWDSVAGKPNIFPANWDSVTGKPNLFPTNWTAIAGKPDLFPPAAHSHPYLPLTGGTLSGDLTAKTITANGYLQGISNTHTVQIGSQNTGYCHYNTTAEKHFFNHPVYVLGDVYAGASYNRRLAYVDELTNSVLYNEVGINATGLDQNKWYPVSIHLGTHEQVEIRVIVSLQRNKPSWATHTSGFSCRFVEVVNGSGWGTSDVSRRILCNDYKYAPVNPIGGVTQNTMGSFEIIYVRGGGYYYFHVSTGAVPTLHTSGYNWVNGTYSYSAPVRDSILNDNWQWTGSADLINRANKLRTARTLWGQSFDGTGNVSGHLSDMDGLTSVGSEATYTTISGQIGSPVNGVIAKYSVKWYNDYWEWLYYRGGSVDIQNIVLALNGTQKYRFDRSGNFLAVGEITAYSASDRRLKENISPLIGRASDILKRLNPVEFDWNDTAIKLNPAKHRHDFSFIADEYGKIFPWAIGTIYEKYQSIDTKILLPLLVAGHNEAATEIDRLKNRIQVLEREIRQIKR